MSIKKFIIRKMVLPGFLFFGLDSILLSRSKKTCCIINFHGVRKSNSGYFNNRHIPVQEFEKTLKYLSKKYNIVSLTKAFEAHRLNKPFKKRTIAITFDDGYMNNFETALPVLKKYNIPATFYLITKGLNTPSFKVWPDLIDILKLHCKTKVEVNAHVFYPPNFFNQNLNLDLLNYLKTLGEKTEDVVNELIKTHQLETIVNEQKPEMIQLVTKEVLDRHKNEALIEYGSHTNTHFNLEYLNRPAAESELITSKTIIETITGKPVTSLAYPDGSYTKETVEISKKAGYLNQVAVEYRYNENNNSKDVLSRFTISNSTTFESNALRLAKQFNKYGFC